MGKGSKARPFSVSKEEFDNRWELIFKKKETRDESNSLEQESMPVLRPGEESVETKGN
jgi:hypothetical protein